MDCQASKSASEPAEAEAERQAAEAAAKVEQDLLASEEVAKVERHAAEAAATREQGETRTRGQVQWQAMGIAMQAEGHAEVVLRDMPNHGQIVAMVPNGDRMNILQRDGGSVKVQWKTAQGWAKTSNVQEIVQDHPPEAFPGIADVSGPPATASERVEGPPVALHEHDTAADAIGFWEYKDGCKWLPYTRDECRQLDAARETGTECSMIVGRDKMPCVVTFKIIAGERVAKQGVQRSLTTNTTRKIRREASVKELVRRAQSLIEECVQDPPDVGVPKYTSSESIREILGRESQPVRLLRGSWVTTYARKDGQLAGLPRRQDLERAFATDAFLPTTELQEEKAVPGFFGCLNVLGVSYCWRAADHPDADGQQLRAIELDLGGVMQHDWFVDCANFKDAGVFWDFCSLHQKDKHGRRTEKKWQQFNEALQDMGIWYLHVMITIIIANAKITVDPDIDYESRGWTHFERSCAELIKPTRAAGKGTYWHMITELAESRRRLPVPPELFAEMLAQRRFTSRGDKEVVVSLYTKACMHILRGMTLLKLRGVEFQPGDGKQLASVLQHCCSLEALFLDDMGIDGEDAQTIATAFPNLQSLFQLWLQRNTITDCGAQAIANALPRMPKLQQLYLGGNRLTDNGREVLQQAWEKAGLQSSKLLC